MTAELLAALWADYIATTPQAERIHRLLRERGERVENDHVALRGYGAPGLGIAALAQPFERAGWQPRESYTFPEKHLVARYWQHPDPAVPKVFISELELAALSPTARALVDHLVAQVPAGFTAHPTAGRPWTIAHADYTTLLAESEYAAWVAAFGFRVNHFTVSVNALATFPDLAALNAALLAAGFTLNTAGGAIKGTPADHLEQSSTLADTIPVTFRDTTAAIPSCYYEFARRYPLPTGELFQGFVPTSANKIFESTDARATR